MAQDNKTSTSIVLEAVHDLHAQEQVVSRQVLVEVTGLKKTIVDDRIKVLVEEGLVIRVVDGVFVPSMNFPQARTCSLTMEQSGWVKLELGNELLRLVPREARAIGRALAGYANDFSMIEIGHQTAQVNAAQAVRIKRLERQVSALMEKASPGQLELLESVN